MRTGRRRAGAAADEQARRLVEIVGAGLTLADDVNAADDIVRRLCEALGADAGAVGFVRGNALHLFGMWNYGPEIRVSRLAPGTGLSGQAWAEGRPLVVADVQGTASYVEGIGGMRSGAYVPGRVRGQVVSVLCVESRRPGAYGDRDVPLLQGVSDLVAVMVSARHEAREAAALAERPLPLVEREVMPAVDRLDAELAALTGLSAADRAAALRQALRSARRLEQLLDTLFAAAGLGDLEVHARDLPLQRVVEAAVQSAGVAARVDVGVPALLRVSADEALLVRALRELLSGAASGDTPAAVTATSVADDVNVQLRVADPGPLRRLVATRLIEAMGGRVQPDVAGVTVLLPPGRPERRPR